MKTNKISSTGSKGHALRCDWWISIHFEGFCFSRFVDTGSKDHVLRYDWWISIPFVIFVGFRFSRSLIADVQIFKLLLTAAKNATVGGDLNFRFRMLLKGAVTLEVNTE